MRELRGRSARAAGFFLNPSSFGGDFLLILSTFSLRNASNIQKSPPSLPYPKNSHLLFRFPPSVFSDPEKTEGNKTRGKYLNQKTKEIAFTSFGTRRKTLCACCITHRCSGTAAHPPPSSSAVAYIPDRAPGTRSVGHSRSWSAPPAIRTAPASTSNSR